MCVLIFIILILYIYYKHKTGKKQITIDIINDQLIKYILHLNHKYILYKKECKYLFAIKNLMNRYEQQNINGVNFNMNAAYTVNKKYIYICLNKNIYNINTMIFVILHELTHVSTDLWDHPKEFWELFKFYLQEAVECGIYVPIDYSAAPESYCKTYINYSQLFDPDIVVEVAT